MLSFEIPSLRLKPSLLSAAPGTRLYVVTVAVGEEARRSARVVLEVAPREEVSFLYELPAAASVRALRLPNGRELTITP